MTTSTKKTDVFVSMLTALRAVYEAEIDRLADLYRPRILAGEFSGCDGDDPRHLRLELELEATHPWAKNTRAGRAVLAASGWAYCDSNSLGGGAEVALDGPGLASEVGECMAHDILAVASALGWVKRYREREPAPYLLRVA